MFRKTRAEHISAALITHNLRVLSKREQRMEKTRILLFLYFSCGPTVGGEMVSRRRILSRSRDDLNLGDENPPPDEEDVWYQKEKLFKVRINTHSHSPGGNLCS